MNADVEVDVSAIGGQDGVLSKWTRQETFSRRVAKWFRLEVVVASV